MKDVDRLLVKSWRVIGAWKADGEDAVAAIDAIDRANAERLAGERGILVESCEAMDDLSTPSLHARANRLASASVEPEDVPMPGRACPICSRRAVPVKRRKGSVLVLIALLFFGLLPGLIYAVVMNGYAFVCPQCGAKLADA